MEIFKQGGRGDIGALAILFFGYMLFIAPFYWSILLAISSLIYEYYYHSGAFFGITDDKLIVFKRLGFLRVEENHFRWQDIDHVEMWNEGYKMPRKMNIVFKSGEMKAFEYQQYREMKQTKLVEAIRVHANLSIHSPEMEIFRHRGGMDFSIFFLFFFAWAKMSIYFAIFGILYVYFLHDYSSDCYYGIGADKFIGIYPNRFFGKKEIHFDWADIRSIEIRKAQYQVPRSLTVYLQSGGSETFYYVSFSIKKQKIFFDKIREHVPLNIIQAVGL